MKRLLLPILSIFLLAIVSDSCKTNCDVYDLDLYHSWTVLQTDSEGLQYNVELRFNNDNSYDWILLDEVEGHSNSHAEFNINETLMTITSDVDCAGLGEYYLTIEAGKLAIISKTESCAPRASALEWVWERK